MKNPPLLFLDTETLGLDIEAPIWDVGAILLSGTGHVEAQFNNQIKHDPGAWVQTLPESFQEDYDHRYSRRIAIEPHDAVMRLGKLINPGTVVCGSNPSFDMTRLERLADQISAPAFTWHYHPIDIPTMAHGWLCGRGVFPAPPWKSDQLSQFCGVDPKSFPRHTAMGDAQWCLSLYRAITKGA